MTVKGRKSVTYRRVVFVCYFFPFKIRYRSKGEGSNTEGHSSKMEERGDKVP